MTDSPEVKGKEGDREKERKGWGIRIILAFLRCSGTFGDFLDWLNGGFITLIS